MQLHKSGFRHWFNQEEIKEINQNNEQYQLRSPEEELLLTWFEPVEKEVATHFLNASQIAVRLAELSKINISDGVVNKLGKALKKHGFLRLAKNKSYVYAVKEFSFEQVEQRSKQKLNSEKQNLETPKIPYRFA